MGDLSVCVDVCLCVVHSSLTLTAAYDENTSLNTFTHSYRLETPLCSIRREWRFGVKYGIINVCVAATQFRSIYWDEKYGRAIKDRWEKKKRKEKRLQRTVHLDLTTSKVAEHSSFFRALFFRVYSLWFKFRKQLTAKCINNGAKVELNLLLCFNWVVCGRVFTLCVNYNYRL